MSYVLCAAGSTPWRRPCPDPMFDYIYIEEAVGDHPRAREIRARFPGATTVPCKHYGEVFNPRAQNFRLQKRRPALILARKEGRLVLEAPSEYAIGGGRNYYFSHMLNCVYDCRYCFLQGMYRSAHLVVFVNYEDFQAAIAAKAEQEAGSTPCFFSGYDCDSLALDGITSFVPSFLDFFASRPRALLELRTKSTRIKPLLQGQALANCVVAFSATPPAVAAELEVGAPPVGRRLAAMRQLQRRGWPLGLRFDPLIYHQGWKEHYRRLFADAFAAVDPARLHSVSLGPFRLPRAHYKRIFQLYPGEKLFAWGLEEKDGMVSYKEKIGGEMEDFCTRELLRYVAPEILFPCRPAKGG